MRITNGNLITWDHPNSVLFNHDLEIENGIIKDFYPHDPTKSFSYQDIDATGQFIFPGNICAHTHFYGAFSRGLTIPGSPPRDFVDVLNKLWWKLDSVLTEKEIYYSALICLIEAIKYGTTTLFDHHSSPNFIDGSLDIIESAVTRSGLRCALSYEVSDRNGNNNLKQAINENARFLKKIIQKRVDTKKISALFGLHASFTLSDQTLEDCVSSAPEGSGFHIHLAESQIDQKFSIRDHGSRIIGRLDKLNILGPLTILAHVVHINQAEARELSSTSSWVTHQPRSNMNNAVGVMPIELLLREHVKLCLGNDGFSNAMWQEWKETFLIHRNWNSNPLTLPGEELFKIVVSNNSNLAQKYFPQAPLGKICKGANADLIFINYYPPTPISSENIFWHILFGFNESMISSTMVAGEFLMKDKKLVHLDEQEIYTHALELSKNTWDKFKKFF